MGVAKLTLNGPANFLKIGAGQHVTQMQSKDHACLRRFMPAIPPLEWHKCSSTPAKNFCLINMHSIDKIKAKPLTNKQVFMKNGDCKKCVLPFHIYQVKFGKIPNYLAFRAKEIRLSDEITRDAEMKRQPVCRFVTQNQRNEILEVKSGAINLMNTIYRREIISI